MNSLIFQYGSAIVGGIAVLSVCIVFLKVHTFQKAGISLLVTGTILIGLPVWSSAKFAWNSEGLEFEFKTIAQKLASLEQQVADSGLSSEELKAQLTQLAISVDSVKATSNLALATFAANPYMSKTNSPLAAAFSSLASGKDSDDAAAFIRDPAKAIQIIKNTEAFTNEINKKVKASGEIPQP